MNARLLMHAIMKNYPSSHIERHMHLRVRKQRYNISNPAEETFALHRFATKFHPVVPSHKLVAHTLKMR
jgi:hypothetical protein